MASRVHLTAGLVVIRQYVICFWFLLQALVSANVELVSSRVEINRRRRDLKKECEAKDLRIAELEAARKKDEGRIIPSAFSPSSNFCYRQSFS